MELFINIMTLSLLFSCVIGSLCFVQQIVEPTVEITTVNHLVWPFEWKAKAEKTILKFNYYSNAEVFCKLTQIAQEAHNMRTRMVTYSDRNERKAS